MKIFNQMGDGVRLTAFLALAVFILMALAALDLIPPGRSWYTDSPMTSAAISTALGTLFGFVLLSQVVERWIRRREASRLRRIAAVAYRSLAQYVNDAGRGLLAPLVGADLDRLAIPHHWRGGQAALVERLERYGIEADFAEVTGSWTKVNRQQHGTVLSTLLGEQEFVQDLFVCTASQRRRLQEAVALWAPVMLASEQTTDDLCDLREMNDKLEYLQENLRMSAALTSSTVDWNPTSQWSEDTQDAYWSAIDCYEHMRDHFAELAELPSDQILARLS